MTRPPNISRTHSNITQARTGAIVNAANEGLVEGGGVCGAIFDAVANAGGHAQLTNACREIGHCPTGESVITPSFGLAAPWIIHAVGPVWNGPRNVVPSPVSSAHRTQFEELRATYRSILRVCRENDIKVVNIPAISTGIYGFPKELAAAIAVMTCTEEAGDIEVVLYAYSYEDLEILKAAPSPEALAILG